MRRKGAVPGMEPDMFSWMALVFAVIFVLLATIIFGIQMYTDKPVDFFSPHTGSGNRIDASNAEEETVRENSVLQGALLTVPYQPGMSMQRKIQRTLYCRVSGGKPPNTGCGFGDFESTVHSILPDVKYDLFITHSAGSGASLEAHRYPSRGFSSGPTVYQTYIPMPGGTNAEMILRIDGPQRIMRWRK